MKLREIAQALENINSRFKQIIPESNIKTLEQRLTIEIKNVCTDIDLELIKLRDNLRRYLQQPFEDRWQAYEFFRREVLENYPSDLGFGMYTIRIEKEKILTPEDVTLIAEEVRKHLADNLITIDLTRVRYMQEMELYAALLGICQDLYKDDIEKTKRIILRFKSQQAQPYQKLFLNGLDGLFSITFDEF